MVQTPDLSRRDGIEDFWLACHEICLVPLEWLTAWWNAFVVPTSCHLALHAPNIAPGQSLGVPEPIAHDAAQNLFA